MILKIDALKLNDHIKEKFDVIVIDPPWSYNDKSPKAKKQVNFNLLSISDLNNVFSNIKKISNKDSHIYIFTTAMFLFEAKKLLDIAGFQYKGIVVWDKRPSFGLGYYFRNCVEFVLFGVKGKKKLVKKNIRNIITMKNEGKSKKPKGLLDYIYDASGEGKYIYIFSGPYGHKKMINIDLLN